ncbi:MAG TPA: hypothetical protein VI485_05290 [Vicinamibacterales bacterium]|nr:hypothetical protein [Vicinamibacterales bacterium]
MNALSGVDVGTAVEALIQPRLIACVAGHYPDGSSHSLALDDARAVIRSTRTRACVFRAPSPDVVLGELDIDPQHLLDAFDEPTLVVPLLNTTGATSAVSAETLIRQGLKSLDAIAAGSFVFAPIVKLEILMENLTVDDEATIACLSLLSSQLRARTIPLISPSVRVASTVASLGCPALRIVSGRLRQQTGIMQANAIRAAIHAAAGRPVILEGGLSASADVRLAADLGASAVLVNSAFKFTRDPIEKALELRRAADVATWSDGWGSRSV